jgi:hypothetical protein
VSKHRHTHTRAHTHTHSQVTPPNFRSDTIFLSFNTNVFAQHNILFTQLTCRPRRWVARPLLSQEGVGLPRKACLGLKTATVRQDVCLHGVCWPLASRPCRELERGPCTCSSKYVFAFSGAHYLPSRAHIGTSYFSFFLARNTLGDMLSSKCVRVHVFCTCPVLTLDSVHNQFTKVRRNCKRAQKDSRGLE